MSSHQVFTGFWLDRSHQAILGATLTLPIRWANFVVSALTIAVTISASCFWIIAAFILHQALVRRQNVDVVGLQHQVILRNSASPLSSLWEVFKILFAWKSSTIPGLWRRTFTLAVPPLIIWIFFTVASLFVSEVASKSYTQIEVLLEPRDCGYLSFNSSTYAGLGAFSAKVLKDTIAGRAYAGNWYGNSSVSQSASSPFPINSLPYSTKQNTSCPFPSSRCFNGERPAFSMETQLLDSHTMFGINAEREDRVQFQKTVSCAVVDVSDLVRIRNTSLDFYAGPVKSSSNYTFSYNSFIAGEGIDYMLLSYYNNAGTVNPVWDPIPSFNRTDADVSMHFLTQNSVSYIDPVFDPWFYANGSVSLGVFNRPNWMVQVMGCVDQHRICNAENEKCTPYVGASQLADVIKKLDLNNNQLAAAYRLVNAALASGTYQSVVGLGGGALLARETLIQIMSPGLPSNQWQLETTRWFETSLAKMQSNIIEFVAKKGDYGKYAETNPATKIKDDPPGLRDAYLHQCRNQRIQSSREVQSFSFLGLMIVIIITILLIIIALSLEQCVSLWRRRSNSHRKTAWQVDGKLHLLRNTLGDQSDIGVAWRKGILDVPVTDLGVEFDRPIMARDGLALYGGVGEKE